MTLQISSTRAFLDRVNARLNTWVKFDVWSVLLPRLLARGVGELRAHVVLTLTRLHIDLV